MTPLLKNMEVLVRSEYILILDMKTFPTTITKLPVMQIQGAAFSWGKVNCELGFGFSKGIDYIINHTFREVGPHLLCHNSSLSG